LLRPYAGLPKAHQYIDFDNDVITLPRSKHGESRHIRMNSVLQKTLKALRKTANSPYVFASEAPDKLFLEICKQAGIAGFTWHCLRHTFASRLVMAGVDLRTVQEFLGHKSIMTTMRYAHLAPEHQANAVERLVAKTSTSTSTKTSTKPKRTSPRAVKEAA
jgi:integrase